MSLPVQQLLSSHGSSSATLGKASQVGISYSSGVETSDNPSSPSLMSSASSSSGSSLQPQSTSPLQYHAPLPSIQTPSSSKGYYTITRSAEQGGLLDGLTAEDMLLSLKHGRFHEQASAQEQTDQEIQSRVSDECNKNKHKNTTHLLTFSHSSGDSETLVKITAPHKIEPLYGIIQDILPDEFLKDNSLYPKAVVPQEQYTGRRYKYESECNHIACVLAWMNAELQGQRSLLQRAVETWRNSTDSFISRKSLKRKKDTGVIEEGSPVRLKQGNSKTSETDINNVPDYEVNGTKPIFQVSPVKANPHQSDLKQIEPTFVKELSPPSPSPVHTLLQISSDSLRQRQQIESEKLTDTASKSDRQKNSEVFSVTFHGEEYQVNPIPFSNIEPLRKFNAKTIWTDSFLLSQYRLYPNFERPDNRRFEYERQCNDIGLCYLWHNEHLTGKKGVLQKVVDKWRNECNDLNTRSRSAKRVLNGKKRKIANIAGFVKASIKEIFSDFVFDEKLELMKSFRKIQKYIDDFVVSTTKPTGDTNIEVSQRSINFNECLEIVNDIKSKTKHLEDRSTQRGLNDVYELIQLLQILELKTDEQLKEIESKLIQASDSSTSGTDHNDSQPPLKVAEQKNHSVNTPQTKNIASNTSNFSNGHNITATATTHSNVPLVSTTTPSSRPTMSIDNLLS